MDDGIKSAWLITYETDGMPLSGNKREKRTQIFYFKTDNPTPDSINKFFRNNDVILLMQKLDLN